jgi:hypothetical protein
MGLQERLDALQPHERRRLSILVGLFAFVCLLLIPIAISAMLADRRSQNEALREAIDRVIADRDQIELRADETTRILARYKVDTPPLAGLLSRHAKELELEIPEFKERPSVPMGKKYEERSTEINLKKVGMRNLVLFMEKVAKLPHPISITKFTLRKRGTEEDSWDAGMTVSSYHRIAAAKDEKAAADGADEEAEN